MGFWEWLMSLFGGWSSDSRYAEEKKEEGLERGELKITRTEEQLEKFERKQLNAIKAELKDLHSKITRNKLPNTKIQNGRQIVTLDQCIAVLMQYVDGMIANKISISQEVEVFRNLKIYWSAARSGMAGIVSEAIYSENNQFKKAARRVNKFMIDIGNLLAELSKELVEEEKMSQKKWYMIGEQVRLAMQEKGTRTAVVPPPSSAPDANREVKRDQGLTKAAAGK